MQKGTAKPVKYTKFLIMLICAVALSVIAAGCDKASKPEGTGQIKDKASKAADKAKGAKGSGDTTEASKLLQEFVDSQDKASYQVTYIMNTSQGGQKMTGTYTQFFEKPNMRMDMKVSAQGQTVVSSLYQLDDKTYSCSTSAGKTNCLELTAAKVPGEAEDQSKQAMTAADEIKANIDKIDAVIGKSETIAGAQATCIEYTIEGDTGTTKLCYTEDGIPLKIEASTTGADAMAMSLIATEFTRSLPAGAFDLPVEPTKMPSMPSNMQTPPAGGTMPSGQ